MSNFLWKVLTFSVQWQEWQDMHLTDNRFMQRKWECAHCIEIINWGKTEKNTEPLLKFSKELLLHCWVVTITWIKIFHFIKKNNLEVSYIYLITTPNFFKNFLAFIYLKCKALLIWDKMFNDFITIEDTGLLFVMCYP